MYIHTTEFTFSLLFFILIIVMIITITNYTYTGDHLSKLYIYAEPNDNNKEKIDEKR